MYRLESEFANGIRQIKGRRREIPGEPAELL
jgi:hypothetical protein